MCVAKGIANGVPMSAVLGRRELIDIDRSTNSTYAGNALMAAAALASVETVVEERLWESAAALEKVVRPGLRRSEVDSPVGSQEHRESVCRGVSSLEIRIRVSRIPGCLSA